MFEQLAVDVLKRIPKNALSRAVGRAAEVPLPRPLQAAVNEVYALGAGIDRDESERPPSAYPTLNDFFTRRLRAGAREIDRDPSSAVVPVDGSLSTFGAVEAGSLLQAKGRRYTVADLLDSEEDAAPFESGVYATFYLSPREYHRIHSPVTGEIETLSYIPGELFPVFPFAVEHVDELFAVNERLVSFVDLGERGRAAVVKVGATCVGRIELTFHGLETNRRFRCRRVEHFDEPVDVENGDEIGVFNLGSTVIVLLADAPFEFEPGLREGDRVRMGQRLGRWAL